MNARTVNKTVISIGTGIGTKILKVKVLELEPEQ